ncbi:MAG: hypothetical protein ABFS23_06985 [Pseudomonadota bacterium]
MQLNRVQEWLENQYDLSLAPRVEDFLLEDRTTALALAAVSGLGSTPEALLVCEQEGEMELSVYLDAQVMGQLRNDNPLDEVNTGNFAPLMLAVEGVSHFVCLVWHALSGRPVSQLAMELQAAVDKFLFARALIAKQHGPRAALPVHAWLFRDARLRPRLSADARWRYQMAGRLAAAYCHQLQRSEGCWRSASDAALSQELCRFYRLPAAQKVRHAGQSK